jgi:hypothetical protein
MTALGATASQHSAAIFGGHAGTEPVLIDSFPIARLKRSFHDEKSILRGGDQFSFHPLVNSRVRAIQLMFSSGANADTSKKSK